MAAVVGIVGTLSGALLTSVMQRRAAQQAHRDTQREQRRQEFLAALDFFTDAVRSLLQAEYNRAKKRIEGGLEESRAEARQQSYDLRTAVDRAYYRLALRAFPHADDELLNSAKLVIDSARYFGTNAEEMRSLERGNEAAKVSLEEFILLANLR